MSWTNLNKTATSFTNGTRTASTFVNGTLSAGTWVNPDRSDLTTTATGGEFWPTEFNNTEFNVATLVNSYTAWVNGTQTSTSWSNSVKH